MESIFLPVERFVAPAPLPYIIRPEDLAKGQKTLVFVPHSDDGVYFAMTLFYIRENTKIVLMSPGDHGVDGAFTKEEKIQIRSDEFKNWAQKLDYLPSQLIQFRADKTYNELNINDAESIRLDRLIAKEKPTMVFIPHISDTAQHMNFNTRKMVVNSLLKFLKDEVIHGACQAILIFEYATNHVPFIPPSDRNLIVTFNPVLVQKIKHQANKVHKSQKNACPEISAKLIEAIDAISLSSDLHQINKRRRYLNCLSGVKINGHTARNEHFAITKICGQKQGNDLIVFIEERLSFPLTEEDKQLWDRAQP